MTVRIFDLNFNEIFDDAVAIYQDKTGYTLGRHDAERLMIQIFSGMVHKWGTSWLASSQQNYLEFMTDDNLDYYGDFFGVDRLDSTPARAIVRFEFTSTLQSATIIYANTIVSGSNDNGTYTFKVENDTFIPAGSDYYDIEVVEFIDSDTNSGEDANEIEIGEIDTLDESSYSYSFVDTVANVVESYGGADGETDDDYRERLVLSTNKFSTAGTAGSYKYWALSATPDIIDVGLTKSNYNIYLWLLPKNYDGEFNLEIIGDSAGHFDNLSLSGLTLDNTDDGKLYWSFSGSVGSVTFSIYDDSAKTSLVAQYSGAEGDGVTIAEQGGSGISGTVDIDTWTEDDTDSTNEILSAMQDVSLVHDLMYPATGHSQIRPLNDIVITGLAEKVDFVVSNITLSLTSRNTETIKNNVLQVVDIWLDDLKNRAGTDVVKSQLEGRISAIDGVHSVSVELDSTPATDSYSATEAQVYFGTFSESNLDVSVVNG